MCLTSGICPFLPQNDTQMGPLLSIQHILFLVCTCICSGTHTHTRTHTRTRTQTQHTQHTYIHTFGCVLKTNCGQCNLLYMRMYFVWRCASFCLFVHGANRL